MLLLSTMLRSGESPEQMLSGALSLKNNALRNLRGEQRKKVFRQVISSLMSLAEKFPQSPEAIKALWEAQHLYGWGLGEHKKAVQVLEKLTSSYPDRATFAAWFKLARYYWRYPSKESEKLRRAVEIYRRLLKEYPDRGGDIWRELVQIYRRLGEKEHQISACQNAIGFYRQKGADDNFMVSLLREFAQSYRWIDLDELVLCYQRAVHEYPKADRDLIARCYLEMGEVYSAVWDTKVAQKYLDKVLIEFKDIQNKKILFKALIISGDNLKKMRFKDRFDRAIARYLEARKLADTAGVQGAEEALLRVAETYYSNLHQPEKARRFYREILQHYSSVRKDIVRKASERLQLIENSSSP